MPTGNPSVSGKRTRYVDLHTHTIFSDGVLSPVDVIRTAKQRNLAAVAVTDHDTMAGLSIAVAEGMKGDIAVVPGIELSAAMEPDDDLSEDIHIIGLFLRPEADGTFFSAHPTLQRIRQERLDRYMHMIEKARKIGIGIPAEADSIPSEENALGRPHVARWIVSAKGAMSMREAFQRFLKVGCPAYVAKWRLSAEAAIKLTHDLGGLAFLAHPGLDNTERFCDVLREMGLDGVEVYHPDNSSEATKRMIGWAKEKGALISGGSDFHETLGARMMGRPKVPKEVYERMKERVR